MTVDLAKLGKIVGGVAAFIIAAGVIWAFSLSAWTSAHGEYVRIDQGPFLTVREYKLAGAETNVQKLQDEVDSLQYDVDHNRASDKDKWLLEQKKKQLQHWKQQVIKIKEGRQTA